MTDRYLPRDPDEIVEAIREVLGLDPIPRARPTARRRRLHDSTHGLPVHGTAGYDRDGNRRVERRRGQP